MKSFTLRKLLVAVTFVACLFGFVQSGGWASIVTESYSYPSTTPRRGFQVGYGWRRSRVFSLALWQHAYRNTRQSHFFLFNDELVLWDWEKKDP